MSRSRVAARAVRLAGALALAPLGCGSPATAPVQQPLPLRTSSQPAAATTPTTYDALRPEHVLESFNPADATESFRVARATDLQVAISTRINPADHFPITTVKVYNVSNEDVIVGYEPGCVTVHCGTYEQSGPPVTFVQRREILRPRQPLEFELSSGEWSPDRSGGRQELLTPSELPPGRYPIRATFHIGGPAGASVESAADWYVVP